MGPNDFIVAAHQFQRLLTAPGGDPQRAFVGQTHPQSGAMIVAEFGIQDYGLLRFAIVFQDIFLLNQVFYSCRIKKLLFFMAL
ncbi:MAG: hypothetical protein IKD22_03400 [Lentisphaeria bacterium]|nr:hypothetical protein [Lentisphaeria bacterium]